MSVDVVVVGSLNLDRTYTMHRLPAEGETLHVTSQSTCSGGKGANQAVAAAKLGAAVALIGAVGDDAAGAYLLDVVSTAGVRTTTVRKTSVVATGEAVIFVDDEGRNLIVVSEGANAELSVVDVNRDFPSASWVVSGFEVSDDCVVAAALQAERSGAAFVLNPSPYRPIPADVSGRVAVMVMNEHEMLAATGIDANPESHEALEIARSAVGAETLVVTLGARGAVLVTRGGSTHITAPGVSPVDTSGAGDAFMGALVARLAAGDAIEVAVAVAVTVGAYATTFPGTQTSYPTLSEVIAWKDAHGH